MSIESTPVGEITPTDLSAGNGTTRKSLPTPVSHGAGVSITLDDDVVIYNAFRGLTARLWIHCTIQSSKMR